MKAVCYLRVSTVEQGESAAGLAAQRATVERECAHRGLTVSAVFQDVESGSGKRPLPGRDQAVRMCARDGATLIAAKLDRLTRSVVDFYELTETARRDGFAIVLPDVGIDTSTPMGRAMAGVVAIFAQLERERIGERTREALQARRVQGVRLGRPRSVAPSLAALISELHADGWAPRAIARFLNNAGVPTPRGGRVWRVSSLEACL